MRSERDWGAPVKIRPIFAWYDFWVGAYWDQAKRRLYVLPLPMIGLVFEFAPKPEPVEVPKGWCDYPKCTSRTGSDWDNRCMEHSYRVDGGRP